LLGRALVGSRIPHYRRLGLIRSALLSAPRALAREAKGAAARVIRKRSRNPWQGSS
jgi:hypothetical protein